jgi:hypothetical protein
MTCLWKKFFVTGIFAFAAVYLYADLSDTVKTNLEPIKINVATISNSYIIVAGEKHFAYVDFDTDKDGINVLTIVYFVDALNVNLMGASSITGLCLIGYSIDANKNHIYENSEISILESYYKLYKKQFEEIFMPRK